MGDNAYLDALTRHLCFEMRMSIWTEAKSNEVLQEPTWLKSSVGDLPVELVAVPELAPFASKATRLFYGGPGPGIQITLARLIHAQNFVPPMALEELVRVGSELRTLWGLEKSNVAITFEIIDVLEGPIPPSYAAESSKYKRKGLNKAKIFVRTKLLSTTAPTAWSNRTIQEYHRLIQNSGFHLGHALLGALAGVLITLGGFMAMGYLGMTNGKLLGGMQVLGPAVGALLPLVLRKVRRQSGIQTGVSGFITTIIVIAIWMSLGTATNTAVYFNGLVAIIVSIVLGNVMNTLPAAVGEKAVR